MSTVTHEPQQTTDMEEVRVAFSEQMTKKRKQGRPKRYPSELATSAMGIRVEVSEREEYEKAAEAAGMKPSVWMRDRLNKAAKRERKKNNGQISS